MDSEKATVDVERLRHDIAANIELLCRELFPSGKKIGHEWCIGDVSGSPGKSLKIELAADGKKGLSHDWAAGWGDDFIGIVKERYGIGFQEAAQKISSVLGTNYLATTARPTGKNTSRSKAGTQREPDQAKAPAAINWNRHVTELTMHPDPLLAQAAERKWTQKFYTHLLDHELIGIFSGHLAFPSWRNGSVVALHYERYLSTRNPNKDWYFEPKGLSHEAYTTNTLQGASRAVVSESYWDLFGYLDLTGLYLDDNTAGICTRGADGYGRLAGLISEGAEVIVLAQNDEPGQRWLQKVREIIGQAVKSVQCPDGIKDFSDWRKAGATIEEVNAATIELKAPPTNSSESEAENESEREAPPEWLIPRKVSALSSYLPPELIQGVLYQGCRFLFAGSPKAKKSWLLMQCCYCVGNGLPFLEFPVTKGKPVYINFELLEGDCRQRFYKIQNALGTGDVDNVEVLQLRGKSRQMTPERLTQLERILSNMGFVLCAIDPFYKLMPGKDERLGIDVAPVLGTSGNSQ
jgi:hypothetical protein